MRVRLNVDLGELEGEPEELYALADVASIACGGHAGDEASMRAALAACARHGTTPGAHPSFEDRAGFGRRALAVAPSTLFSQIVAQCTRLAQLASGPTRPRFVKPHGALYHAADADPALARAVVDAAAATLGAITVIGPAGGALAEAAAARGLPFWREAFADRARVRVPGSARWRLVPRSEPGALIEDPEAAAALARELVAEGEAETVCVHGDDPSALAVARAVRAALDEP